ncbi:MAG: bifunctional folylpolyglutamate synthase/dihydrofolate synthase [Thermoanaerobaculia bacterium]|nr:bifunctional folylpolyglutamate synthase/dihydrofolate synthase [Thermoanaerobaculia bacterium]
MSKPAFTDWTRPDSLTPKSDRVLSGLDHFGLKLGLERIRDLLVDLGEPHLAVPTVLIAGTNGKGSTASLLSSIARASGYRTGLFTSPHLESLAERISVDGEAIADDDLYRHLTQILGAAETAHKHPPTFFEALTLAAFLHYRHTGCDLAVLEVGLGGRLDATNVSEPLVSVVTSIGLDHQGQLGNTLTAIAGEKAGIARPHRRLIAWAEPEEVDVALRHRCNEIEAHYVPAQELVSIRTLPPRDDRPGQRGIIDTPSDSYRATLRLPGLHQLRNLALAVLTAETLAEIEPERFGAFERKAVEAGAASASWPARLEWVDIDQDRKLLLDAGHNPAGVETLLHHLNEVSPGPYDLFFGAVGDKNVGGMLPPLARGARHVTLTRPPSHRSGDPHDWLHLVPDAPGRQARVVVDPVEAVDVALEALPAGGVLVMTGSIYLLGDVRREIRRRYGRPAATVPREVDPAVLRNDPEH